MTESVGHSRKPKCTKATSTFLKAHGNIQSALDDSFYKYQKLLNPMMFKGWRVAKYTRVLKISWKTTLKRNEVVLLIRNSDAPGFAMKLNHFRGWISSDEWGIWFKVSVLNKIQGEKKKPWLLHSDGECSPNGRQTRNVYKIQLCMETYIRSKPARHLSSSHSSQEICVYGWEK